MLKFNIIKEFILEAKLSETVRQCQIVHVIEFVRHVTQLAKSSSSPYFASMSYEVELGFPPGQDVSTTLLSFGHSRILDFQEKLT